MARPRNKKSKLPFSGLNLKPEEDEQLIKLLEEKDISARALIRSLLRQWMKEGGNGILKYSIK